MLHPTPASASPRPARATRGSPTSPGRARLPDRAGRTGRRSRPTTSATSTRSSSTRSTRGSPPGPIPDGAVRRPLLLPKGESGKFRLAEIVGGLPGPRRQLKLHRHRGHRRRRCGSGKVFYRDERLLRNRIEDLVDTEADGPRRRRADQKMSVRRQGHVAALPGASSTAGRACSTAAASRSSSTTSSPTKFPATRKARLPRRPPRAHRCATRSAWSAPASISAAPTLDRAFLLNFTLYDKASPSRRRAAFARPARSRRTAGRARRRAPVVAAK